MVLVDSIFYCPQTKLREGNVFTPVCQSFCSWGGGSLYDVTACLAARPHVPSGGISVSSFGWGRVYLTKTPWADSSLTETTLDRDPPWTETPPDREPPGQRPHQPENPLYDKEQTICILLESILVGSASALSSIDHNSKDWMIERTQNQQERIQLNANHLLAESTDYIKFEGM